MKESKVSIGLVNPKSPENVQAVMRLAGNYSVESVYFSGERYSKAAKLKPCSVDMSRKVSQDIPLIQVDDIIDDLIFDTPDDLKIVCVELAENAKLLPEYQHPKNALYIFGAEDSRISQQLIDRADDVVYIPTVSCMNLSATVNVVLYDRMTKSAQEFKGNEHIRKNRNTNNRLKVKI